MSRDIAAVEKDKLYLLNDLQDKKQLIERLENGIAEIGRGKADENKNPTNMKKKING